MDFRTAYGKHKRSRVKFAKKGRTKQSFAKECDINNIIAKYQRTGAIEHFSRHAPRYGDVSPQTFHQAMNIVTESTSMFEELPANIRARFDNDPAEFLGFVQDPANQEEMVELGLVESAPEPVELPPVEDAPGGGEPSLEGVSEAATEVAE